MGRYAWYVVKDRRYSRTSSKGWQRIVEYRPRETDPVTVIPSDILEHYEQHVEWPFGYAPMRGLTATQCEVLTGLDKGGVLRVGINRMGDIASYKID